MGWKAQNGALQGHPLDEVDLEHFHTINLAKFVMVALGFPWLPEWLPRAQKGLPMNPGGEVGGIISC